MTLHGLVVVGGVLLSFLLLLVLASLWPARRHRTVLALPPPEAQKRVPAAVTKRNFVLRWRRTGT